MNDQKVFHTRREYNRWVANQTLEDYALRFTAKKARRWSIFRVSNTALGAISFLALEAIGATITLEYGFNNTLAAVMVVSCILFLCALPISYYAAKYGVDIDLLSRGAGFGYLGSTITSLIYASFTFIFFALEAVIMASALELLFDIPKWSGYLISSLLIIPLVTHGITLISRFQMWSQPVWLILQLAPFVIILFHEVQYIAQWQDFTGKAEIAPKQDTHFFIGDNLILFGAASGVLFSLISQIGEQVDFLRFLPEKNKNNARQWWTALLLSGPGWILVGGLKILAGSLLLVIALQSGLSEHDAVDPTHMYLLAFGYLIESPQAVLAITGIFVILCQVKINVTNAYAGSIAWSNFFSRLTHSHPGRVVWVVFNVIIALLLMGLGIYQALEPILAIYSIVAIAWIGTIVADLIINKPLGLSPKGIEFRRAYLYDINPVGVGTMFIASIFGLLCLSGLFHIVDPAGYLKALAPYITLTLSLIVSPCIAYLTRGRFYLARDPKHDSAHLTEHKQCVVCENNFDTEDLAHCPIYRKTICSLCCSLESRCQDRCKTESRFSDQVRHWSKRFLPKKWHVFLNTRTVQFSVLMASISFIIASLFVLVYKQLPAKETDVLSQSLAVSLFQVYLLLIIVVGILVWLFVLANESRRIALEESISQTSLLSNEIKAHEITDQKLQLAKETADTANRAKSRYLSGISHELRSPLNAVLGYAQLLEKDALLQPDQLKKVSLIRRSGDHLSDLIEGLLDISKIEAGRIDIRRDKVDIRTMLAELDDMFSLQAQQKSLEFITKIADSLPAYVYGDGKHIRQILINLLSNSIKYTEHGRILFNISYRNQVAEFNVHDSGVGISKHEQERIFKPFERIRNRHVPQTAGTGLGLTISHLLTEIMGGDIAVDSSKGNGSLFTLTLMLSPVLTPPEPIKQLKTIYGYQGSRKTIMVVDDDASHRGLISEILTPLGFDVLEAESAVACLENITEQIDLFLLDITMPGMNGWQLLSTLRSQNIKTPIMMVSADAYEEFNFNHKPQQPQYDGYLTKPISDDRLLLEIGKLLQMRWHYSQQHAAASLIAMKDLTSQIEEPPNWGAIKELAELGYVDGIKKILDKMPVEYEIRQALAQHLEHFQFQQIINFCDNMVNHE